MRTKPIPGAAGYTVSDAGVVSRNGIPLRVYLKENGAQMVHVNMDAGYPTSLVVARAVGQAFCPEFHPDLRTAYVDGNPANARADNLIWVSRASVTVTSPGGKRRTAKLTQEAVDEIRNGHKTRNQLAEKFGITATYVSAIRTGRNWRHTYNP